MLNTTNSYDYEASYQQTTLTGDVAGWFTIAETSAGCNYSNISSQAQQAAAAAGFALANYSRFVYVFPANGCGWWGLGTVGGTPSHAWVHARYGFNLTVVGHEMGHNLGCTTPTRSIAATPPSPRAAVSPPSTATSST